MTSINGRQGYNASARVIGSVVATDKDERLVGVKLLVIQPINSRVKTKARL